MGNNIVVRIKTFKRSFSKIGPTHTRESSTYCYMLHATNHCIACDIYVCVCVVWMVRCVSSPRSLLCHLRNRHWGHWSTLSGLSGANKQNKVRVDFVHTHTHMIDIYMSSCYPGNSTHFDASYLFLGDTQQHLLSNTVSFWIIDLCLMKS